MISPTRDLAGSSFPIAGSDRHGVASPVAAGERRVTIERAVKLALIAIQLGLVFAVMQGFSLEQSSGILKALPLIFGGFLVHALLPMRARLPFFLLLSGATLFLAMGATGIMVASFALLMIGIAHLPIAFRLRIAMITATGAGIAALSIADSSILDRVLPGRALPVLASILMFRMAVYLYDLRHAQERIPIQLRIAYFFLPPNFFLPLFPIVDFEVFRRTYFNRSALEIYNKGVSWIFRGVTHLILYRIVYYYLAPDPDSVAGVADAAIFVVTSWLIYLHVSGLFHIAAGILCLFGFNLPETHRLYFLASSPSEVWRRANIYWKDFMMKLFYYPVYTALKRRRVSMTGSIVIATIGVFAATWFLHSYQWFWLLGRFPLSTIHVAFWTILAVFVLADTLLELRPRRKRSLDKQGWSIRSGAAKTLKVMATFGLMSLMWSWWNTGDTSEWLYLLGTASDSRPRTYLVLAPVLAGIAAAGIVFSYISSRGFRFFRLDADTPFPLSLSVVLAGSLLLLGATSSRLRAMMSDRTRSAVEQLLSERLNERDEVAETRSYYEAIITTDPPDAQIGLTRLGDRPVREDEPFKESSAVRPARNFEGFELVPSRRSEFRGNVVATNRWGMRDRDYTLEKPPRTWRAAIVGASVPFGWGVAQDSVFEPLLEDRLNREKPFPQIDRYEILNFAVAAHTLLQYAETVEQRAVRFEPDILLFTTLGMELRFARESIQKRFTRGDPLPPPVETILQQAGVTRSSRPSTILRRLTEAATAEKLHTWAYQRIAESCRRRGIAPVWVYLPPTDQRDPDQQFAILSRAARSAGFVILDLRDVYRNEPPRSIILSGDRLHPSATGHQFIADRLYAALLANSNALGLQSAAQLHRTP